MSEVQNPNDVFDKAIQGIQPNYWGQDKYGVDMWEYKFTDEEVDQANEQLKELDLDSADQIAVARNDEPSTMTGNGYFIPGRDSVSFQLKSEDTITLISLSKFKSLSEPAEAESDIVVVEKSIQVDGDYEDITNLVEAIATGTNIYAGLEGHLDQIKEVTTPEMLAVSALSKMLPGNRDKE